MIEVLREIAYCRLLVNSGAMRHGGQWFLSICAPSSGLKPKQVLVDMREVILS